MDATVNDLKERELREKHDPSSEVFDYASKLVESDLADAVRIFRSGAPEKKSHAERKKHAVPV